MKSQTDTLLALFSQFCALSLMAFGGANAVVPEMHRQAVSVHHWMSGAEFATLFAIAQAAPGPNFMISTLIGWKAAGIPGALVATVAMCAPSCLLTFWVARVWERYRSAPWRRAVSSGVAPVTVGLVAATSWLLMGAVDRGVRLTLVTMAAALGAALTRLNPLWILAAAAGLGLAGFL